MSDMKMSDVFELPMVQGSIVLMSNDHRYVIEFDASDSNVGDQIEHVAHAINNHDRMVEEIAELKLFVTNLSNSPIHAKLGTKGHNGYEEHLSADWKEGAKELLAKLQKGEE